MLEVVGGREIVLLSPRNIVLEVLELHLPGADHHETSVGVVDEVVVIALDSITVVFEIVSR